jgi:hypothetical protein
MVPSSAASVKVTGASSMSTQDPLIPMETSYGSGIGVLDVTLSGHTDVVDRGNVYNLLAECLRDVSFSTLVLHNVTSYYFFDRLFL